MMNFSSRTQQKSDWNDYSHSTIDDDVNISYLMRCSENILSHIKEEEESREDIPNNGEIQMKVCQEVVLEVKDREENSENSLNSKQLNYIEDQWNLYQVLMQQIKTITINFLQNNAITYMNKLQQYQLQDQNQHHLQQQQQYDSGDHHSIPLPLPPHYQQSQQFDDSRSINFLELDHDVTYLMYLLENNSFMDDPPRYDDPGPTNLERYLTYPQLQSIMKIYQTLFSSSIDKSMSNRRSFKDRLFTIILLYHNIHRILVNKDHVNHHHHRHQQDFIIFLICKCFISHEITPFFLFYELQQYQEVLKYSGTKNPYHENNPRVLLVYIYTMFITCISNKWKSFYQFCNQIHDMDELVNNDMSTSTLLSASSLQDEQSKKALLIKFKEDICGICLLSEPLCPDLTTLCCGSNFHMGCLLQWFHTQMRNQFHGSCPTCRNTIKLHSHFEEHFNELEFPPFFQHSQRLGVRDIFTHGNSPSSYSDESSSNTPEPSESSWRTDDSTELYDRSEGILNLSETDEPFQRISRDTVDRFFQPFSELDREELYRMGLERSPSSHPDEIEGSDETGNAMVAESSSRQTSSIFCICSNCRNVINISQSDCRNRCCSTCCRTQPLFCPFHYQSFLDMDEIPSHESTDSWSTASSNHDDEYS